MQERGTHAGGGCFHHTAWGAMTPQATHLRGRWSAGSLPSQNQGIRRRPGLCTAVESASPEQKDATAVIAASPAWGRGSCNGAKCSLFVTLHWNCITDCASQEKLQGHFFLVLSKTQFPLSSWRIPLIILQGTNKFNWPSELILDLHCWLQIHFKQTLWTRNINTNNFTLTFFKGVQKSSLWLSCSTCINNWSHKR